MQGVSCKESLARSLSQGVSCEESLARRLLQAVSCEDPLMKSLSRGVSREESLARILLQRVSQEESLARTRSLVDALKEEIVSSHQQCIDRLPVGGKSWDVAPMRGGCRASL